MNSPSENEEVLLYGCCFVCNLFSKYMDRTFMSNHQKVNHSARLYHQSEKPKTLSNPSHGNVLSSIPPNFCKNLSLLTVDYHNLQHAAHYRCYTCNIHIYDLYPWA